MMDYPTWGTHYTGWPQIYDSSPYWGTWNRFSNQWYRWRFFFGFLIPSPQTISAAKIKLSNVPGAGSGFSFILHGNTTNSLPPAANNWYKTTDTPAGKVDSGILVDTFVAPTQNLAIPSGLLSTLFTPGSETFFSLALSDDLNNIDNGSEYYSFPAGSLILEITP